MTLEDYRPILVVATILLMAFECVNGLLWAKMLDERRLPIGWGFRLLVILCTLTPLGIWTMLFFPLSLTA